MKVFITTSGIGSRLGQYTEFMNKSMLKVGKKPVIAHIIDQYPSNFEFVITLGYKGDHIKQFLTIAYPNHKFTFVNVDKYQGEGTSQVYSQLQAKEYLQEPFIYNDCDTIVENLAKQVDIENFNYDFLIGYNKISGLYDGFDYDETSKDNVNSYKITKIYQKGASMATMASYIGISGIYDWKTWWNCCERAVKEVDYHILNDTYVYINYKEHFSNIKTFIVDNWYDTGSVSGLITARKHFSSNKNDQLNVLDKYDQSIFIVNNKVIKFFANDDMVKKIMTHTNVISKFMPKILDVTKNFFSYAFVPGNTSITNIDRVRFGDILEYYKENGLWDDKTSKYNFKKEQYDFWITRTKNRVNKFKKMFNIEEDKNIFINGVKIPKEFTVDYILDKIQECKEWKEANWTSWHGDFTLENILIDNNNNYSLIDCRQGYGNELYCGDKIYDYVKMNMNLLFNFSSIYNNLYNIIIDEDNNKIHVDILVNSESTYCKEVLKRFVEADDISYDYIEMLTGIIFLDLCPLFEPKLCKFLFYFGKYVLYSNMKNNLNFN